MKKLIILSALLATLAACNNLENSNQQTVSTTTVVNTLNSTSNILQEVEIGMETEDALITALGCSLNKIPKKFLTDEYSYYNGNICIFRRSKAELLVAFREYKEKILKNIADIEKELES